MHNAGESPTSSDRLLETNKRLVRRVYEEGLNEGKFSVLDELIDEKLVDHSLFPGRESAHNSFKNRFALVRTAFPDAHMTVEEGIAEGDRVVYRWTLRGTHTGPFGAVSATGRHVEITGMNMTRIANGKIVEHWANFDHLGLLQQLNVMQGPGRKPA